LLGLVKDGQYSAALSDVAVADAATLGADSHVSALAVAGASADIATNFSALASNAKVSAIALSNEGGTLTLTGSQIVSGTTTLAKISNAFQIAATNVAMTDLAEVQGVEQVASLAVSDTAANVSDNFSDLLSLGGSLANLHLTDTTPVLALTQADWTSGAGALAKIDGSYQVDLSEVVAGDATTLAGESTVRQLSVADTSGDIANSWSALISLYNGGAGKLAGIALTDADPLTLTAQQQTDGDAMITALLPDETILTSA
jgi:hypothetical protein